MSLLFLPQVEKWKACSWDSKYEISDAGRVKSVKKNLILSQRVNKSTGYVEVTLWKDGKEYNVAVHRLVAIAFIPNAANKPQVNHKDGKKLNCNWWNLEWNTCAENVQHAFRNGLSKAGSGERHWNSKISDADREYIRNSTLDTSILAAVLGLTYHNVWEIRNQLAT